MQLIRITSTQYRDFFFRSLTPLDELNGDFMKENGSLIRFWIQSLFFFSNINLPTYKARGSSLLFFFSHEWKVNKYTQTFPKDIIMKWNAKKKQKKTGLVHLLWHVCIFDITVVKMQSIVMALIKWKRNGKLGFR